jgi:Lysosomal transcription factor, NCU-G1
VEANSDHDSIHYIWDFSKSKKPSILVALTKLNTTLQMNWTNYVADSDNAISFSAKADYVFVAVLNKVGS